MSQHRQELTSAQMRLLFTLQLTGLKLGPAKEYIDKEQGAQSGERNLDQVISTYTHKKVFKSNVNVFF